MCRLVTMKTARSKNAGISGATFPLQRNLQSNNPLRTTEIGDSLTFHRQCCTTVCLQASP